MSLKLKIDSDGTWNVFGSGGVWLANFSYEKDALMFIKMHEAWYYSGEDKKGLAEKIMRGDR